MVTIRKGESWGSVVAPPPDLPVFADHRDAGRWLRSLSLSMPVPAFGVRDGDLARTMGGGGAHRFEGDVVCAPVDLVEVTLDDVTFPAATHVVLRRRWWRGRVVMAMNAQFLGRYDVAPRSHPNDGRVDVIDVAAAMTTRTRLQARRRARSGTHVPHPEITVSSVDAWKATFERPMQCWLDGCRVGRTRSVTLVVRPDALRVHA